MNASKSQRTERKDFITNTSNTFVLARSTPTRRTPGWRNKLGGIAAGQMDSNQKSREINPHDWDSENPFTGDRPTFRRALNETRGVVASLSLCRSLLIDLFHQVKAGESEVEKGG